MAADQAGGGSRPDDPGPGRPRAGQQRDDPVAAVVAGLVDDGTLTTEQARRVEAALRAAQLAPPAVRDDGREPERRERIVEILAYLGGALVLGALALIVGLAWGDLSKLAKLAICGGASALLLGAAMVVAWPGGTGGSRPRRTLASTLGAVASAGAALTTGVAIGVGDLRDLVVPGLVMVVVAAVAFVSWRAIPAVCAVFVGGFLTVIGALAALPDSWRIPVVIGAGILGYGAVWLAVSRLRSAGTARQVAGVLGGATAALGAEVASADDDYAGIGLVLGIVVIAALFALFWTTRQWWYAALGAASALVVPPTALGVIWGNSLVVGIVLLVIGVALIVGAVATVRRRRRPGAAPVSRAGS